MLFESQIKKSKCQRNIQRYDPAHEGKQRNLHSAPLHPMNFKNQIFRQTAAKNARSTISDVFSDFQQYYPRIDVLYSSEESYSSERYSPLRMAAMSMRTLSMSCI